jgi:hypothetical protein
MSVARKLPGASADSSTTATQPSRTGTYGEAYVTPITSKELLAAGEGSYFTALTPTPGTGVVSGVVTTNVATTPYLVFYNGNSANGPCIYPQYLRLYVTVASTNSTGVNITWYLDNINRWTSGGTALTTASTLSGGTTASNLTAHIGVLVSPAASANQLVAHTRIRGTIDVVEDLYEFTFGTPGHGAAAGSRAATVTNFHTQLPAVCIQPGHSLVAIEWAGSQSVGITCMAEFGYLER